MRRSSGLRVPAIFVVSVLVFSLGMGVSINLLAHPTSQSYLLIDRDAELLNCRWLFAPEDLVGSRVFGGELSGLGESQILAARELIETNLLGRLSVSERGKTPSRTTTGFGFTRDGFLELAFRFDFDAVPLEVTIQQDVSPLLGHPHLVLVTLAGIPGAKEVLIGPRDQGGGSTVKLDQPPAGGAMIGVVGRGMNTLARHPDLILGSLAVLLAVPRVLLTWTIVYFLIQWLGILILVVFDLQIPGLEMVAPLLLSYVAAEKLFLGSRKLFVASLCLLAFVQGLHGGALYRGGATAGFGTTVEETLLSVLLLLAVQSLTLGLAARLVPSPGTVTTLRDRVLAMILLLSGLLLAGRSLFFS
ncbi:MAG: hypothetical protein JSU96_09625 [Acidobacteriota bacterium]|nr:MAG: hypothetical protein JSU96_09625 [Acidobacteriota bacterium]